MEEPGLLGNPSKKRTCGQMVDHKLFGVQFRQHINLECHMLHESLESCSRITRRQEGERLFSLPPFQGPTTSHARQQRTIARQDWTWKCEWECLMAWLTDMRIRSFDVGDSFASERTDRLTLVASTKGVWYVIATVFGVWMYCLFVYSWRKKSQMRKMHKTGGAVQKTDWSVCEWTEKSL